MATLKEMKIFAFDNRTKAENHLMTYELTYPDAHHYKARVDRAYIVVNEAGIPPEKSSAGWIDENNDIYVIISSPVSL